MNKLLLGIAALLVATPALAQGNEVRVAGRASGSTLVLHRGQSLVVSVQACVGCAYRWSITRLPPVLAASGSRDIDTTPRSGPGMMVGGNKTVEYRFRTLHAGRGVLELRYAPFSGEGAGSRTVRLTVVAD